MLEHPPCLHPIPVGWMGAQVAWYGGNSEAVSHPQRVSLGWVTSVEEIQAPEGVNSLLSVAPLGLGESW